MLIDNLNNKLHKVTQLREVKSALNQRFGVDLSRDEVGFG